MKRRVARLRGVVCRALVTFTMSVLSASGSGCAPPAGQAGNAAELARTGVGCIDPCEAEGTCVSGTYHCFDSAPLWEETFACDWNDPRCEPDRRRWTVASPGTQSTVNDQDETYRASNVSVASGSLVIEAESEGGGLYSGLVRTGYTSLNPTGSPGFGWGRIDIRARVPVREPYTWPSLWIAHPHCTGYGVRSCPWPFEADILDQFGSSYFSWGNYFSCNDGTFGCGDAGKGSGAHQFSLLSLPYFTTDDWHVYSLTRQPADSFGGHGPAMVCLWLDGQAIWDPSHTYQACVYEGEPLYPSAPDITAHVLDAKGRVPLMQIIMNVAIGGNTLPECQNVKPGERCVDPATYGTHQMEIESVKVYEPPPCPENCVDTSPRGYSGYSCDCG